MLPTEEETGGYHRSGVKRMPIDAKEFRNLLGQFAAGVTVITTTGCDGKPYGLTVTAFTSVSLQPPLVLVCVDKKSETHAYFVASNTYAVNFLTTDQQDLSNRFAKSGGDKFQGVEWSAGAGGAPLLAGALAHVECSIVNTVDAGDHTIFVGQVEEGAVHGGEPLLYFSGAYRGLAKTS
jgi:flavin reductase (DIM6/NTAB) family NADH-FMN oxidoreductase RutF